MLVCCWLSLKRTSAWLAAHHSAVPPWKCCDGPVVKVFDRKSNGIFPLKFESYSQRWQLFTMARQKEPCSCLKAPHPTPTKPQQCLASMSGLGVSGSTLCSTATLLVVKPWLVPAVTNLICATSSCGWWHTQTNTNPTGSLARTLLCKQLMQCATTGWCKLPTCDETNCALRALWNYNLAPW